MIGGSRMATNSDAQTTVTALWSRYVVYVVAMVGMAVFSMQVLLHYSDATSRFRGYGVNLVSSASADLGNIAIFYSMCIIFGGIYTARLAYVARGRMESSPASQHASLSARVGDVFRGDSVGAFWGRFIVYVAVVTAVGILAMQTLNNVTGWGSTYTAHPGAIQRMVGSSLKSICSASSSVFSTPHFLLTPQVNSLEGLMRCAGTAPPPSGDDIRYM